MKRNVKETIKTYLISIIAASVLMGALYSMKTSGYRQGLQEGIEQCET